MRALPCHTHSLDRCHVVGQFRDRPIERGGRKLLIAKLKKADRKYRGRRRPHRWVDKAGTEEDRQG